MYPLRIGQRVKIQFINENFDDCAVFCIVYWVIDGNKI